MTRSLLMLVAFGFAATASASVIPPIPRIPGAALKPAAKPADPESEDDPAKIAERIAKNTKEAGDKLGDQDTGDDTRKTQEQILKDIDALLKKSQESPPMGGGGGGSDMPPPMGGMPPPMGGQPKGGQQPKGGMGQSGQQPKGGWRDRTQGQPKQQPMGGADQQPAKDMNNQQPMGVQGGQPMNPMGGGGARALPAMPLDDAITKQVWGHLPERLRQQMSQYYKEQFMPKYADMLRQYYTSLAEREKAPKKQ